MFSQVSQGLREQKTHYGLTQMLALARATQLASSGSLWLPETEPTPCLDLSMFRATAECQRHVAPWLLPELELGAAFSHLYSPEMRQALGKKRKRGAGSLPHHENEDHGWVFPTYRFLLFRFWEPSSSSPTTSAPLICREKTDTMHPGSPGSNNYP